MDTPEENKTIRVSARWVDNQGLDTLSADEVFVQDLGDRVFVTVGQLRLPLNLEATPSSVEIKAVMRLQFSRESFAKLGAILDQHRQRQQEEEK